MRNLLSQVLKTTVKSPYLVTTEGCWTSLSLVYFYKFFEWHWV